MEDFRVLEVGADEVRAQEVGTGEVRALEVGAAEVRVLEIGLAELRVLEVGVAELRPPEVDSGEVERAEGPVRRKLTAAKHRHRCLHVGWRAVGLRALLVRLALLLLSDGASPIDRVATGVAATLARRPAVPLPLLADQVALSECQLCRRVEAAVGYPPRTLAPTLRFQRFLHAARSAPPGRRDLARLAAEVGYADQAHLTRESR